MLLKHWRNIFGIFLLEFPIRVYRGVSKKMLFVTFSVQNCNFCPHFPQQSEELPLNKFILLEFEFFRSWIQDILLTVRFFSLAWSPLLVAIVLDHLFVWQLWVLELLLLHSGHQFYFSVCLLPLGAVIEKHSLSLHLYADDIQIYLLLKGFSIIEAIVIQPSSRPRHQLTFQNFIKSTLLHSHSGSPCCPQIKANTSRGLSVAVVKVCKLTFYKLICLCFLRQGLTVASLYVYFCGFSLFDIVILWLPSVTWFSLSNLLFSFIFIIIKHCGF